MAELKYIIIAEISNDKATITENVDDAHKVLKGNILDIHKLYPNWLNLPFDFKIDTYEYIKGLLNGVKVCRAYGNPEQILDLLSDIYFDKKNILRNQIK